MWCDGGRVWQPDLAPIRKSTWPSESWPRPCLLLKTVHWAFCPLRTASRMPVLVWTFFNGQASACSACHSLCWEGDRLQSAVSPGCVRPPGPWSQQVGLCLTPPDPDTISLRHLPLAGGCRWPELKRGVTFALQGPTDTTAYFLHSIYQHLSEHLIPRQTLYLVNH